jgi:hypothetical protein
VNLKDKTSAKLMLCQWCCADVRMHRTGNELMEFLVCLGIYMGLIGF